MKKTGILTVLILLLFVGCTDNGKKEYEGVKRLNSKEVYEKFILDNYSSIYADSAYIKVQEIVLKSAKNISDYETFLNDYPESILIPEVKSKLSVLKAEKERKAEKVRRESEERRRQQSKPCYGIELVSYKNTSYSNTTIYAKVRNNSNRTKIVYFDVLCNDIGWTAISARNGGQLKVYPNDITEGEILTFSKSNYGGKIRIRKCE